MAPIVEALEKRPKLGRTQLPLLDLDPITSHGILEISGARRAFKSIRPILQNESFFGRQAYNGHIYPEGLLFIYSFLSSVLAHYFQCVWLSHNGNKWGKRCRFMKPVQKHTGRALGKISWDNHGVLYVDGGYLDDYFPEDIHEGDTVEILIRKIEKHPILAWTFKKLEKGIEYCQDRTTIPIPKPKVKK
jgi:hypothetical protein